MSLQIIKLEKFDKDNDPSWKYKVEIYLHLQDLCDVVEKGDKLMQGNVEVKESIKTSTITT